MEYVDVMNTNAEVKWRIERIGVDKKIQDRVLRKKVVELRR